MTGMPGAVENNGGFRTKNSVKEVRYAGCVVIKTLYLVF